MEDKIFEMVIESMKQKLIFSDMVEMRKIIKGAVKMMEAHYEDKMPNDKVIQLLKDCKDVIILVHEGNHSELKLLNRIDKTINKFCKQSQLTKQT